MCEWMVTTTKKSEKREFPRIYLLHIYMDLKLVLLTGYIWMYQSRFLEFIISYFMICERRWKKYEKNYDRKKERQNEMKWMNKQTKKEGKNDLMVQIGDIFFVFSFSSHTNNTEMKFFRDLCVTNSRQINDGYLIRLWTIFLI